MVSRRKMIPSEGFQETSSSLYSSANAKSSGALVELRLWQIVLIWILTLALLSLSFSFGYGAGRAEGFRRAIASYSRDAVRMPIVRPLTPPGLSPDAIVEKAGTEQLAASVLEPPAGIPKAGSSPLDEPIIDFKTSDSLPRLPTAKETTSEEQKVGKLSPAQSDAPMGLKSKPALSDVANNSTADKPIEPKGKAVYSLGPEKPVAIIPAKKDMQPEPVAPRPPVPTVERPKPKPETETPAQGKLKSGWYVQAAAAKSKGEADELISKLRKSGVSAFIQSAVVRKNLYFRVVIGPFPAKNDARQVEQKVRALGLSKGDPFLREEL